MVILVGIVFVVGDLNVLYVVWVVGIGILVGLLVLFGLDVVVEYLGIVV